jgi:antitoxin component of MazEF toxin-antitoxin module
MNEIMTQMEVRRLQKMADYSLAMCIPKNLAKIMNFQEGGLVKIGVNERNQLIVERAELL